MKYLKLYEAVEEKSFGDWFKTSSYSLFRNINDITSINCEGRGLTNLKGVENFPKLTQLWCRVNHLKSLKGVENLVNLNRVDCDTNQLENLHELENCNKLRIIFCYTNKLTSLKGLADSLKELYCEDNLLTNLDDILNMELRSLHCTRNPFEYPVPKKFMKSIYDNNIHSLYDTELINKFCSYEFQKSFIEEHPEKIEDLEPIGFDKKIIEEYKDLLDFFNVHY